METTQQNQGGESQAANSAPKPHPHAPHGNKAAVVEHPIFCAGCQAVTPHKTSVIKDRNGNREIVSTCDCGYFLKFPEHMIEDRDAFVENVGLHHKHNAGQITAAQEQAESDEFDEKFLKMMGAK